MDTLLEPFVRRFFDWNRVACLSQAAACNLIVYDSGLILKPTAIAFKGHHHRYLSSFWKCCLSSSIVHDFLYDE